MIYDIFMQDLEKIAVLNDDIEAQRLEKELKARDIRHIIVSYHDSAYDGLFQFSLGWGHVAAESTDKDVILEILAGLREAGTS